MVLQDLCHFVFLTVWCSISNSALFVKSSQHILCFDKCNRYILNIANISIIAKHTLLTLDR